MNWKGWGRKWPDIAKGIIPASAYMDGGKTLKPSVRMKTTIFWDMTPCSPLKVSRRFLLWLFFDPEDGDDMFLRNVRLLSTHYTALHPKR
jgi:hypothetical protein